jgi:hypothetical protein
MNRFARLAAAIVLTSGLVLSASASIAEKRPLPSASERRISSTCTRLYSDCRLNCGIIYKTQSEQGACTSRCLARYNRCRDQAR